MYVFGNMRGQRYTRNGWKTIPRQLVLACVAKAELD
jgi:hypothetical protein